MKLDLRIEDICFQAPWLEEGVELSESVLQAADFSARLSKPKAKAAPMGTRRRMPVLSKLVIDSALNDSLNLDDVEYAIFSSRHGESSQKAILADNVLNNDPISPTVFSQSVHNTSAGMYSIFKGCKKPTTTIAAGKQSLSAALLEAKAFLLEHPNSKVLVVAFGEELCLPSGASLDDFCDERSVNHSLAMVVSNGAANVRVQTQAPSSEHANDLPEPIQFLQWWLSDKRQPLSTPGQFCTVQWQTPVQ